MRNSDITAAIDQSDRLEEAGDVAAALSILTQSIERFPDEPWLRARRGRLLKTMEDWKSAIVDFDVALALQPDAPSTLFLRGSSYARLGDFESAVRDLEACTRLQPNAADAYWELGVIHAFRRHLALAIASYETALAIAPAEYPGLAEELVTLKSELESQ